VASSRLCSRPTPQNDQTSGILPTTSTISPSTAAARLAKLVVERPARGGKAEHRYNQNTGKAQQHGRHRHADRHDESDGYQRRHAGRHDVPHDMFCKVKTALDVAVMRLVNVPGMRSAK